MINRFNYNEINVFNISIFHYLQNGIYVKTVDNYILVEIGELGKSRFSAFPDQMASQSNWQICSCGS